MSICPGSTAPPFFHLPRQGTPRLKEINRANGSNWKASLGIPLPKAAPAPPPNPSVRGFCTEFLGVTGRRGFHLLGFPRIPLKKSRPYPATEPQRRRILHRVFGSNWKSWLPPAWLPSESLEKKPLPPHHSLEFATELKGGNWRAGLPLAWVQSASLERKPTPATEPQCQRILHRVLGSNWNHRAQDRLRRAALYACLLARCDGT
jgi:hypothetical protein